MRKEDVIKNSIFYNSEVQRILKEFSKLQMEWLIKEIKREPYELMKEIKMKITDENLEKMWDEFDDISIDEEECIDVNFYNWKKGTDRYDIWHWFDENHSKGVAWLMGVV